MPYIGKQLSNGNYLKLDDISSGFDSSTTTFSLTNGGSAYYPGSEFSILVSVGGVIQEPESAYQINNDQIIFANAPTAQDSFFCIVLGDAIGINVPGNNTVNGAQMAKPFNYDGGLLYLNDTDNRVGINSTSPSVALDVVGDLNVSGNISGIGGTLGGTLIGNVHSTSGISTFNDLLVNGDLTVQGDTTTLNTTLRNVELLRVSAASTMPAGIITQTNTGDILRLYDSSTQVFTVADGGKVGIGTDDPNVELDIEGAAARIHLHDYDGNQAQLIQSGNGFFLNVDSEGNGSGSLQIRVGGNTGDSEKLRITSDGDVGIGTNNPNAKLNIYSSDPGVITPDADADELVLENGGNVGLSLLTAATGESSIYFGNPGTNGQKDGWIKYYHETHATTGNRRALTFKSGGGSEKMRISSAGRLGIGTVNPNAQLDVYKSGTGTVVDTIITRTGGGGAFAVQCSDVAASNPVWALRTYSAEDLVLSPGGHADANEKVRIKASDGNVGIATKNPSYRLQVQSDGTSTTAAGNIVARFQSNGSGRDATIQLSDNVAHSATISMLSSNLIFEQAGTETLRITSAGDVGIGTTNPAVRLEVEDTINAAFNADNSVVVANNILRLENKAPNSFASMMFRTAGGGDAHFGSYQNASSANDCTFYFSNQIDSGGGQILATLDSATGNFIVNKGSVGIGTDNPTDILDINSDSASAVTNMYLRNHANLGGAALNIWTQGTYDSPQHKAIIGCTDSGGTIRMGAASNHPLLLLVNNEENIRINTDGNVGIGTDDPSDKLSIAAAPNSLVFGAKDTSRKNHIFQLLADDSAGNGELRLYKNSASGDHEHTVEIASHGVSYFNSGNVGIGTANPSQPLTIARTSAGQSEFGIRWQYTNTTGPTQTSSAILVGSYGFKFKNYNSSRDFLFETGRVAIGTDTMDSSADLSITNTGAARIYMKSGDDDDCSIYFGSMNDSATGGIRYDHDDDSLRFMGYNNVDRVRITRHGGTAIFKDGTFNDDTGWAGLEVRADSDTHQLVLSSASNASNSNQTTLGFKLHPSYQNERIKAAIVCQGSGGGYGEVSRMMFCIDKVGDNGNAQGNSDDERLRLYADQTYGQDDFARTGTGNQGNAFQAIPTGVLEWKNNTDGGMQKFTSYIQATAGDVTDMYITLKNSGFYRITIRASHNSQSASLGLYLVYGLNNMNAEIQNIGGGTGFTLSTQNTHVNSHDTTLKIDYSGSANQGLRALVEVIGGF